MFYIYVVFGFYLVMLIIISGDCMSSMSMIILIDFDIFYDEDCFVFFLLFKIDSLIYVFLNLFFDFGVDY